MGNTVPALNGIFDDLAAENASLGLEEAILPFDNLQIEEVEAYWRSFYDHASSFALDRATFRLICGRATVALGGWHRGASTKHCVERTDQAFDLFGCHENGNSNGPVFVDALEFLSALAFVSDIALEDKVDLLFDSYDMSEDGCLEIDEFTISLKSTLCGLVKILKNSNDKAADRLPDEDAIDHLADKIFREIAGIQSHSSRLDDVKINCDQFRKYCLDNKTARGLFDFFDKAVCDDTGLSSSADKLDEEMMLLRLSERLLEKDSNKTSASSTTASRVGDINSLEDHSLLEGDEFLAVKPWKGAIVPPTKPVVVDKSAPSLSMKLDFVFGYSAQDGRNNLRYFNNASHDEIVYPAAGTCIVMNTSTKQQRHFIGHTDDVLCVALHPNGSLVASGEIGRIPKVMVWDGISMEIHCVMKGYHRRGILAVAFEKTKGNWLVSVGADDDHSIAVHESKDNWMSASLTWSSKGNKAVPMHVVSVSDKDFVTCGVKHVDFWQMETGKVQMICKRAIFGKKGNVQQNFYVAESLTPHSSVVVGTNDGELYLFDGKDLRSSVKAHKGAVFALHGSNSTATTTTFVSGGKDGQIMLWNHQLQRIAGPFNVASLNPCSVAIKSCCLSSDLKKVLIGTLSSEIFEVEASQGKALHIDPLMRGHFLHELWGLDVHPSRMQCCTVGDDKTLRIWDLESKKELRSVALEKPARACAYSHDGKLIAVGFGDGSEDHGSTSCSSSSSSSSKRRRPASSLKSSSSSVSKKNTSTCSFQVFNEMDLAKVKDGPHDAKKWICDIKFSPDDKLLALSSHDTNIYVYDTLKGFAKRATFKKHNSYVSHFDFSSDGNHLQSVCGAYELLYSESKTGKQITNPGTFRDEKWHSQTCTLGWSVQGIWPDGCDGTDVNSVDRSRDGRFLASGDDFGKVKVFRFPCALENASNVEFSGHCSHVTNVRWSANDAFLVSVGGNDRCVFVWKHDLHRDEQEETNRLFVKREPPSAKAGHHHHHHHHRRPRDSNQDEDEYEAELHPRGDSSSVSLHGAHSQKTQEEALFVEDIGDEFMAVKPWMGAIVAPSNAKPANNASPDSHLELERVHGYEARSSSNNARYDASGNFVVYHAAALGILYDLSSHKQAFNKDHDDDVIALCAHPNGQLFATAQLGKKPKIYVSCVAGKQHGGSVLTSVTCLEGFHKRSVTCLCFSSDGKKLASIGGDDDHSIAIYNWESGMLVASAKGERSRVLGVCFQLVSKEWVTCGDKHIRFWKEQGHNLSSKKAVLSKAKGDVQQVFESVVSFVKWTVVGTEKGWLYLFAGNELSQIVKAHGANVYALYSSHDEVLVSGSKDGTILLWDAQMKQTGRIDLRKCFDAALPLLNFCVRSVCLHPSKMKLLVGTTSSDLFEIDRMASTSLNAMVRFVTRGHFLLELWGLSMHPSKQEYATVGDDRTLRIWSLSTKKMMNCRVLDCMMRCVSFAFQGDALAVGFGGRAGVNTKQIRSGGFVIVGYEDISKTLFEDRPSKQWISEIKFSRDGKRLAVGSHDTRIYLYGRSDAGGYASFKRLGVFDKHRSYITHFDFSSDGRFLQSNCGAYELLYQHVAGDGTKCKQITNASSVKDVVWQSWTCTLGWPVQGIWPPCSDGTDINAVDRAFSGDLLVTGDDFGKIKLFRYPCLEKTAGSLEYNGHASHVMNVRWSVGDQYAVSVGGNDRCIMEWKHISAGYDDAMADSDHEHTDTDSILSSVDNQRDSDEDAEECFDHDDEEEIGDEFMAVKPWLGAIVAPSNAPSANSREPDVHVELDWVYGYQSELSTNNLRYNDQGEIVYHTAAVGIIYDKHTHLQKHHLGHQDDILCLAISPKGELVATGERGKKPTIRVWSAHSGDLRCELKGFHQRGVLALSFSEDSQAIISVGDDDDHSVGIWADKSGSSWGLPKLVASSKGDKALCHFAVFTSESIGSASGSGGTIAVTGGSKHLLFWELHGKTLTSKKGRFGSKSGPQTLYCGCFLARDQVVTGSASGELLVWQNRELSKTVKAHANQVTSVFACVAQKTIISGGKDGKVILFNSNLQQLKCFDVNFSNCLRKSVQSVCMSSDGKTILAGTASSDILEMDATNGNLLNDSQAIASGHFELELWGLAVHPTAPLFVTTGDDKTLRVWNMQTKTMEQLQCLPDKSRTCCFSPDARFVAVGTGGDNGTRTTKRSKRGKNVGGSALIFDTNAAGINASGRERDRIDDDADDQMAPWQMIFHEQISKEWISEVKFAPSSKMVAFGSHDNSIYFYSLERGTDTASNASGKSTREFIVNKRKAFAKHNSYITHFDFSKNGRYLQSNCGAYELLFCDVMSSEQVRSASAVKDVVWDSWTCTLGWPVQGIWPEFADGTDINAVCASNSRNLLATGDDSSNVKLFRFPCIAKGSRFIQKRGHSSHVTNVRFSFDDRYLLSTGGNDRSIFQWKLV